MCYSDDARPPLPPVGGAAADARDLVLTSADGTRFAAYAARAERPSGAGMVILPDVRGLHGFYKELAERFAEAGIDAVAIDYFGRTAGLSGRDEGFDYKPHVEKASQENIAADAAAAIAFLRSPEGGAPERVYTVGFCFGGSTSWNQSALQPGLAGAIGFYGMPQRSQDLVGRMKAPILILAAGADFTPVEAVRDFAGRLSAAGVPNQMHVYPNAPHSFFDRTFAQHRGACDDAWRRILEFTGAA